MLSSRPLLRFAGAATTLLLAVALTGCVSRGDLPRLQKRAITGFYGRYSDNALTEDILLSQQLEYENSDLVVLGYSQIFHRFWENAGQWEWEAQVGKHFGLQDHWELNGLALLRWNQYPWSNYVRTSFAVGDGLSWASSVPTLELASHTNEGATPLLNYLLIELTFGAPKILDWDFVFRIHHRSGIFGTFNGVDGGSNVIGLGLKYRF